jgi:hypothetical protein
VKKFPLVEVEWLDAMSVDEWTDYTDASGFGLAKCRSVGYQIVYNDICMSLAGTINDGDACCVMTIPLSLIVSARELN